MAELRPRGMSQGELAELLREHGFSACSKAAVSLAERPKDSGVQFTQEARNAVRGALNSARRAENRKHGAKTTVWFDEDTRAWLEQRAYMEDSCVGEVVRRIVAEARTKETKSTQFWMERIATAQAPRNDNEKAAADLVHPQRQEQEDAGASL